MKESRRSDREIKSAGRQHNGKYKRKIAINNLEVSYKLLLTCKAKRRKVSQSNILYKSKRSSSLEVSCSFLVHLSHSQVFSVNNIFKIQSFAPFKKIGGPAKGP